MEKSAPFTAPSRMPRAALVGALTATFVTGALYAATMRRTYGFIDSGELAAVATTLGIAHPTGYPTFTLLGHLAVRLVPWARPVVVLNALSALWTALAAGLASLVLHEVLRSAFELDSWGSSRAGGTGRAQRRRGKSGTPKRRPSDFELAALSSLAAAFIGLSTIWWSQATGFEVYSLHAVLLGLILLFALRYLDELGARQGAARFSRSGVLFSIAVGLGFTNHLSTVMLSPTLLYPFFRATGLRPSALQELARLAPGAVIGLLPYAYLPIRASMHPRLNWGDPETLDRFLAHISGAQFHFAFGFDERVFRQQTQYLGNTLWSDLTIAGAVVAALGCIFLFRRARVHAVWTGVLFLTCAVVSGLYDINDIGNYYLPIYLVLGVWLAAGLAFLAERVDVKAAVAAGGVLVALNAVRHDPPMNERENTLVEDLVWNVLHDLPPNAVVFSNHWDYWVSGSLYAQEVEGFRRDVVVLDPESLRSEWYLDQLQRSSPELTAPARAEVDRLLEWARKLETQRALTPREADAYYAAYYGMVSALIERNTDRSFYVTEWTDPRIAEGHERVPTGLTYRLSDEPEYLETAFPTFRFRPWTERVDPYVVKIAEIYTAGLLARARYEDQHGRPGEGRKYGVAALRFEPGYDPESVLVFPLHIEDQLVEILQNYGDLRDRVRRASER